jgi:hypothetical protein
MTYFLYENLVGSRKGSKPIVERFSGRFESAGRDTFFHDRKGVEKMLIDWRKRRCFLCRMLGRR